MKSFLSFLLSITLFLLIPACKPEVNININDTAASTDITYDSTLAKKLGADD